MLKGPAELARGENPAILGQWNTGPQKTFRMRKPPWELLL